MTMRHGPLLHTDGTTTFRVWAPHAQAMALDLDGRSVGMIRSGEWFWTTTTAADGQRYGFVADDGPLRPDPASRRQPSGVHEPSQLVDPAGFTWCQQERSWRAAPLSGAVIYELHVGTFTPEGTFAAASTRLADLRALGVTHVEVMPVNAFEGRRGWGYDGVSWYTVHETYGGPAGLAAFVDACHRHGLSVVLDVVYNHLGPSGSYLPEFGPYLTDRHTTPWGDAINLDGPGSDAVRAYIIDNAVQWFADYHVDGLRLDAVHGLVDTSAVHVLHQLSDAVGQLATRLSRPLQLIAESDRCDPLTITPRIANGLGMDAQWADDLHHAIHVAVTGERDGYYTDYRGLPDVGEAYRRGFLFDGRRYSLHRGRTVGAPLGQRSGHHLISCIQNHDQVGNRPHGRRLTELCDAGLVRVAVVLLCAAPTTPMLFMGEEFAATSRFQYFTDHPDELAEAVRVGRQREFAEFSGFTDRVPDPGDPATFQRSSLDWSQSDAPAGRQRRALWSDLLRLRQDVGPLANGRRELCDVRVADQQRLLVVREDLHEPPVALAVNLGPEPVGLVLGEGSWEPLLDTADERYGGDGATSALRDGVLEVPARAAALWTITAR